MILFLVGGFEGLQVVGGGLVDVVVQPVGVDELAGRAPANDGLLGGVVVGEVVLGDLDLQSLVHIPLVLQGQGVAVVFQVAQEEELTTALGLHSNSYIKPSWF